MGKSLRILIDFSEVTLCILEKVHFGVKAEHCAAEQGIVKPVTARCSSVKFDVLLRVMYMHMYIIMLTTKL